MPKFNGPGRKKKACILRRCLSIGESYKGIGILIICTVTAQNNFLRKETDNQIKVYHSVLNYASEFVAHG